MTLEETKHREIIVEKIQSLKGRVKDIATTYYKYTTEATNKRAKYQTELEDLLLDGNPQSVGELFMNGPYQMFEQLAGKEIADKMNKIASRMHDYVYSPSTYRRSFRTKQVKPYFSAIVNILSVVFFPWDKFNLEEFLRTPKKDGEERLVPVYGVRTRLIALEIDERNTSVINAIKDICLGDNNTKLLDDSIIRSMLMSHDTEMHQLLCDLLLAAKLQEGLRQSILENADLGSVEAFILLLKTVADNNLIRYSSALRAMDVWMGIGEAADDKRKRVTEKLIQLIYTYLTDKAARKAAENSKDVLEMYASLWATSVYEVTEMEPIIDQLMKGEKYQKLVALYFVAQADYKPLQAMIAAKYIEEQDLDTLAYILSNINMRVSTYGNKDVFKQSGQKHQILEDAAFRNKFFDRLIEILPTIPQDGHAVIGKPFDWGCVSLTRESVFSKLLTIAAYENDGKRNAALLQSMAYSDPDNRIVFVKFLVDEPQNEEERAFIFSSLEDKSMSVRSQALKVAKNLQTREDEEEKIVKLLALKTGDIRQGAVDILLALPLERSIQAVKSLLSDKNENKRLAGLDILTRLRKEEKIAQEDIAAYIQLMPKTSDRERILIEELTSENRSEYTKANGFGLYKPDYMKDLNLPLPELKHSKSSMSSIFGFSYDRIKSLLDALCKLIEDNKDYSFSYIRYDGHTEDTVLGTLRYLCYPKRKQRDEKPPVLEDFVLPEVWRGWLEDNKVSLAELTVFSFSQNVSNYNGGYRLTCADWAKEIIKKQFNAEEIDKLSRYIVERSYARLAVNIIPLLVREFSEEERFNLYAGAMIELMQSIPANKWTKDVNKAEDNEEEVKTKLTDIAAITGIVGWLRNATTDDERFKQFVAICYELGQISGVTYSGMVDVNVARAYRLGLVPRDALLKMAFLTKHYIYDYAGQPRYKGAKELVQEYPIILETATEAAARVIDIEIKRGDTPTEVSHLASKIRYHEGAENFANILVALGNETFVRGYGYSSDNAKKPVLSCMLKSSHPSKDDNAKTLKKALDGRVSDMRLLEAAMYAPAWLSIVANYLGWKGLESAAWYFHAHINESFSAEKETEVARYSPITAKDFNDGAFDVDWFKDAYKTIGKDRFQQLYDCSKYLTDGANHRRAQMFADAALGNLKLTELEKEIKDKRNKDKLLAYSLIPLKKNKEKDLLARYEFIQKFLKESKEFGAQRQESEAKASAIALDNLARTAGFADSLRLSWRMETLKIEQISNYFTPKVREGVAVSVCIDEQGIASLLCEKEGKILASVPAKLKKDKYILECKDVVASLKAQQKRAKASLETAMIRSDQFTYAELSDLMKHPVISPILQRLLFIHDKGRVGMFDSLHDLPATANLRIAHPYDLYQSGEWLKHQRYAFEQKLVQPFKQIFRELYIPNDDELHEGDVSRRYAGHQVQVQKTVALLKTRAWTVDYESGLQKVYYKENIIATMYAAADWFSPADVEAPTLETVRFYDRKTYKTIKLSEISPIIFSEVMRDIDLVVSVAHVGGVDPEASHSTVEMRASIVRELLALLRIENVMVKERHAQVVGSLGEYTVHLGSGVVHKMGRGAVNILAVPSQHRGRVFLPFADEDPRTAEIMSKILLLADDKSIKDTAILGQIE